MTQPFSPARSEQARSEYYALALLMPMTADDRARQEARWAAEEQEQRS